MASVSSNERFYHTVKHFPPVINGRLNVVDFVAASTDLVAVVERLGTIFLPVKVDVQGNIDKIKKFYVYDENSCLLELMLEEKAKGNTVAAEGVLWLNRALLFFELIFMDIVHYGKDHIQAKDVDMKKIYTNAYEKSVQQYHSWVTQKLFVFICKMAPDLPHMMKLLEVEDLADYVRVLETYNITLHLIRCKIDDFFKDNNILSGTT